MRTVIQNLFIEKDFSDIILFSLRQPNADEKQATDQKDLVKERTWSDQDLLTEQFPLFYCAHTEVQWHPNESINK